MSHYENNIDSRSPEAFTIDPSLLQNGSSRFDVDSDPEDPGNDADCDGDFDDDFDNVHVPQSQSILDQQLTAEEFERALLDDAQSPEANVGTSTAVPMEIDESVEVDQKKLDDWMTVTVRTKCNQIENKQTNIKKLSGTIEYHRKRFNKRQAEYDREYKLKAKGQHELDAIVAAKNESQRHIKKKEDERTKVNAELEDLRKQVAEIKANPRTMYLKDKKSSPKGKSPKEKDDAAQDRPAGYDPDSMEEYDSLSENEAYVRRRNEETPQKNAKIACRRCRFKKGKCQFPPGQNRCRPCIRKNGKCCFDDPVFEGRQLPKNYLDKLHPAHERLQSQVDEYQKASFFSVWSTNPLSGITGYGPRSPRIAEQNFWRMARGMDPIYGVPSGREENHFPLAMTKEERKKREGNSKEPQSKKRKADSEGDRSISDDTSSTKRHKPNSSDNRQQETLSVPQSQAGSSDRSNEKIANPPLQPESQDDQVGLNDTTIDQHLSLPQTHGISITETQLQYASSLSVANKALPLDTRHLPIWPGWTLS